MLEGFTIETVAHMATAIGVAVAAWHVGETRKQAATSFEDGLAKEYRELAQRLPVDALLGDPVPDAEYQEAFDGFYRYIDLCNEQVFLRQMRRLREETWMDWCQGIQSNLRKPAFARAWEEIKQRTSSFAELRRLEASGFKADPAFWGRQSIVVDEPRRGRDEHEQISRAEPTSPTAGRAFEANEATGSAPAAEIS